MASEPTDPTRTIILMGPGAVRSQRYRIAREIGRGGFGTVFLAYDQQLHDKPVVVKIRNERTGTSDVWRERKFREECEALARIDHPGIVGILDQGQTSDGKPEEIAASSEIRQSRNQGSDP